MRTFNQWLNSKVLEHIAKEGIENCNESYNHYCSSFIEEWFEHLPDLIGSVGYAEVVDNLEKYGIKPEMVANEWYNYLLKL